MEELPYVLEEEIIDDYEADDDSDDLTEEEKEALRIEDFDDENWETIKLPDKS